MSMSQAKKRILRLLLEADEPVKLQDIAKETGLSVSSSMMHLLWLGKAGYVVTPKKSWYNITESGKKIMGVTKVGKEQASHILRKLPIGNAFHFSTGIDQYLGVYANSLIEFCEKIREINPESIEFHVSRRDFESWLHELGDRELAEKIGLIREMALSGEELRRRVYETTKSRWDELARLSGR